MFKGPAALTGSSTAVGLAATGAVSVGTTLGVTGTSTLAAVNASGTLAAAGAVTVGTTLGVTGTSTLAAVTVGTTLGVTGTSTLAAVNASGVLTMGNNINIVVSGGGTISGLPVSPTDPSHATSKSYVDTQVSAAGGGEGLVEPVASPVSDVIAPLDTTGKNIYLINADPHVGNNTMTMDLNTGRSVSNSDTWTIVWAGPQNGGTSAGIKVDLGANKLYDANGTLNRYITLPNVGSSVRLVWSAASSTWHIIGGSGGIPSTS